MFLPIAYFIATSNFERRLHNAGDVKIPEARVGYVRSEEGCAVVGSPWRHEDEIFIITRCITRLPRISVFLIHSAPKI